MGRRQRNRDRTAHRLLEEHVDGVQPTFTGALVDLDEALRPDGTVPIKLISPGWGSKGYYSAEVLKRDGPKAWPAGTHMYLDHPSLTEAMDRPERSVRDLAAVLETGARWSDTHPQGPGLYAEANVFPPFREAIAAMAPHIGVSIRARGTGRQGEAEGRTGPIVESIDDGLSCDFVTKAGRGGQVLALAEAAGLDLGDPVDLQEAGTVGSRFEAGIHSDFTCRADDLYGDGRLTRDERIALSNAIGDALAAFVAAIENTQPQLYERGWWDEPAELCDPNPDPTEESPMPMTAEEKAAIITELRESVLEEARGAVAAELEEARTTAAAEKARGDRAEHALLAGKAQARALAEAAKIDGLPQTTRLRVAEAAIAAELPTTVVDGVTVLDEAAFDAHVTTLIDAEVAYLTEAGVTIGGGQVTGAGTTGAPAADPATNEADLAESFQALGLSESAAKTAAAGR